VVVAAEGAEAAKGATLAEKAGAAAVERKILQYTEEEGATFVQKGKATLAKGDGAVGKLATAIEDGRTTVSALQKAENEISEFIGGAKLAKGETGLDGLKNAANLTPARLQSSEGACGLYVGASVIEDVKPGTVLKTDVLRADILKNATLNNKAGLKPAELTKFLETNLPDAAVLAKSNVTEEMLLQELGRANQKVIAGVDSEHYVRLLGTIEKDGAKWVQIYDPARGNYDQLLTSFLSRCRGPQNELILIRP
jgi:hypothetical protein